jgi:hypothetical protein
VSSASAAPSPSVAALPAVSSRAPALIATACGLGARAVALEQSLQPLGILLRAAAADLRQRRRCEAGISGETVSVEPAAMIEPHRLGLAVQRDLVEPGAVDDHRLLDAERSQRARHRFEQPLLGDAEQLHARLGRVHAGAEDVHDRADAERAPHRPGMAQAGMILRRVQEADARLVERAPRDGRRAVELHAELLEHVGRAAARGDRTVAVLGDRQAGGGGGEGDRGGEVDRARPVAAGAAAVGEQIVRPVEGKIGGAQRAGGADQLLHRLAADLQRDQHRGDRRLVERAADERAEQQFGLVALERRPRIEQGQDVGFALPLRRRLGGEIGHVHGSNPAADGQRKSPPVAAGLVSIKGGLESRHHRCRRAASAGLPRHQSQARAAAAAGAGLRDAAMAIRLLIPFSIPIRRARVNRKVRTFLPIGALEVE